jgi:curli biogenesis system outer membrane secretion channel CsgG
MVMVVSGCLVVCMQVAAGMLEVQEMVSKVKDIVRGSNQTSRKI